MGKPLLVIGNITSSIKAKQILAINGIHSDILRTPKIKINGGCSYSLTVDNLEPSQQILTQNGIKIISILYEEVKR